jgi:hypothetical protein
MIESYRFGEMVIDGKAYHADLIVYPERIDAGWWRKEGHTLCLADIAEVVAAQPECFVVGTGNPGLMKVLPETRKHLQQQGIQLIVEPTEQAYQTYNTLSTTKQTIGAFHLTC